MPKRTALQDKRKLWQIDPNRLSTRDVLLLIPIVLALLAAGIAFAFPVSNETYIKWGGLTVDTAVVLAFVVTIAQPSSDRLHSGDLQSCS